MNFRFGSCRLLRQRVNDPVDPTKILVHGPASPCRVVAVRHGWTLICLGRGRDLLVACRAVLWCGRRRPDLYDGFRPPPGVRDGGLFLGEAGDDVAAGVVAAVRSRAKSSDGDEGAQHVFVAAWC